jgi:membrane protease YdiL (CAAX protease family)
MAPNTELEHQASSFQPPVPAQRRPTLVERTVALLEVLLCSDYPTQFALGATFAALGYTPFGAGGRLSVGYVVALSLIDTVALIGLILMFLSAHGERPRDVFLGGRPIGREAIAGLPMTLIALAIGGVLLATIQQLAPWLHTVEYNPFLELVRTPRDAVLFAIVVVVAGGVREEIQRAFLLRRFEAWLGGGAVGVVVASSAFGAGHLLQGADAAITTGLLGAFWAVVYLRRRSVVAPIVSHSCFNVLELVQFFALGR